MTQYLNSSYDLNSKELIEVIDEVPFWSAPFGVCLLEHIRYKAGITALDIGFGTGFPLTEIAMRLGNKSKVFGIDPWEAACDRARKKLDIYGIQNVEIINGVAEDIPLKEASIDLITSNNGINNVSNLPKTLSECARVLKPGGQFIQTINLNTSMMEFYHILEEVLKVYKLDSFLPGIKNHIYDKRKPLHEFLDYLKTSGFEVTTILNKQFEYTFADGTALFNHYFIRLAFLDSWKALVPEKMQVEIFQKIEDIMNHEAQEKGCFKLRIPFVLIDSKKNK